MGAVAGRSRPAVAGAAWPPAPHEKRGAAALATSPRQTRPPRRRSVLSPAASSSSRHRRSSVRTQRMRVRSAWSAATSSTCSGCRHSGQETSGCSWPSWARTALRRQASQKACPQMVRTGCQKGSKQIGQVKSDNAGSSPYSLNFRSSSSRASRRQMLRAGSSATTPNSGRPEGDATDSGACLRMAGFWVANACRPRLPPLSIPTPASVDRAP